MKAIAGIGVGTYWLICQIAEVIANAHAHFGAAAF